MKKLIIATPDETASPVALPDNTHALLDWPVRHNSMCGCGSLSGGVFTANTAGLFNFNVSSQGNETAAYQVVIRQDSTTALYKGTVGELFANGTRQTSSKSITLRLEAGETVSLFDYQTGGNTTANRWLYGDTNRIEISFED